VFGQLLRVQMINSGTGSVTELSDVNVYAARGHGLCGD
jgi:hypothetical protein